jgi:uncharacterized membrane protein (DUF106 family)
VCHTFIIGIDHINKDLVLFGLILGIVASEIISAYWRSRYPNAPKVYAFNRRIHHGELGVLLTLSAFLLRRTNPAVSIAAAVLTGIGLGLVKDDRADIMDWFKLDKNEKDDAVYNEEKEKLQHMQKQIRSLIDAQEEEIELQIKRSETMISSQVPQ